MIVKQLKGQFYQLINAEVGDPSVTKRGSLARRILFMFDGKKVNVLRGNLLVATKDIERMMGV